MSSTANGIVDDQSNGPFPIIPLPSYPYTAPVADDPANNTAGEMSLVHNVIIRSFNAIWHNASIVSPKDVPAFIAYSKAALAMLHEHHETEEKVVFPVFAREGLAEMVEENVGQHKAFHDAMEELDQFLTNVERKPAEYNAEKLKQILDTLGGPLVKHLHEEITTLQPENLNKIDRKVLDQLCIDVEEHLKAQGGFTTLLPFMMTGHKSADAPAWPPYPGPVRLHPYFVQA
ncbi:hypothetical protein NMY22_g8518 [Coprinellus aureogranulatus]|nr:hypothetical protein NMY22_g8518 [Coprinellus aureogranulatus]